MRGHEPVVVDDFRGLFRRGTADACPTNYFQDCLNLTFSEREIRTRFGFVNFFDVGTTVLRAHIYKRAGETLRVIVLTTGGEFYDWLDLGTPILTVATATDFSLYTVNNLAYITPHDGKTGISGSFVYVYNGTGVARKACGSPPSGTMLAATSSLSGYVEEGTHLFAVAYETASGFITKPGPALFTVYVAPGEKKVDLSDIPTGPSGISKRHILATKSIETYDGNQLGYEFFFVPNGTISNNVDTTLTVDFFDADLFDSADYLFDQLEELPACLGLGPYMKRMVAWGGADGHVVYVSLPGEPESFNALDGFCEVGRDIPESVRNCVEFRNSLYMMMPHRTFITADPLSDAAPAAWEVLTLDRGIGTEVNGVAAILDSEGTNIDSYLVASRTGLLLFNGVYQSPELSYAIRDWWTSIRQNRFHQIQVVHDPITKRIYISVPISPSTDNNYLMVGDYSEGMTPDKIKWCPWTLTVNPKSIYLDLSLSNETSDFVVAASAGTFKKYTSGALNDDDTAINAYGKTGLLSPEAIGRIFHFNGVRLRGVGNGDLSLVLYAPDDAYSETLPIIALSTTMGVDGVTIAGLQAPKTALKISMNIVGGWFKINALRLFYKLLWSNLPY